MRYIFKGILCGYICPECPEPLSQVKVRLYRSRAKEGITVLAAAAPKDTFAILSDDDVKQKASSLLAETTTGDDGSFSFELGDEQKYGGEAFEIDVYLRDGSPPQTDTEGSPTAAVFDHDAPACVA